MNIHQQHSSHEHIQPQHTESIGDVSDGIDYINAKNIKCYQFNKGPLVLINSDSNQIEYAFGNISSGIELSKKDMVNLRMKWHAVNKNPGFIEHIITAGMSKVLNKIISSVELNKINQESNTTEIKNPNFPDGTFIYKNQYGKEFKVVTLGGKAINITCDNNYITGHQKGAIQRAINENRVEKFEEFIPIPSTNLQVIQDTSHQVESIIDEPLEGELLPNIHDNLEIIYINYQTLQQVTASSLNTSKVLFPALSILKLLVVDIEISNENLQYLLSTDELIESLFETISINLKNQLKTDEFDKITTVLQTLKSIFKLRLSEENGDINKYNTDDSEDLDVGDDIFTSGFDDKEDISEQEAWNIAMNGHRNHKEAEEYRAKH